MADKQPWKMPLDDEYHIPEVELPTAHRRVCEWCKQSLRPQDFTSEAPICRDCEMHQKDKELEQSKHHVLSLIAKPIAEAVKANDALPRLERVFSMFVDNLGGEEAFALLWAEHFRKGLEARPGSHSMLQMFHQIAKVNLELSKRQQQEEIIDLSDKQLKQQRELARMSIVRDIMQDPGSAGMLMEALNAENKQLHEAVPGVSEAIDRWEDDQREKARDPDADASAEAQEMEFNDTVENYHDEGCSDADPDE